jgi:hypothetical protein
MNTTPVNTTTMNTTTVKTTTMNTTTMNTSWISTPMNIIYDTEHTIIMPPTSWQEMFSWLFVVPKKIETKPPIPDEPEQEVRKFWFNEISKYLK